MRNACIDTITELATDREEVVALVADNGAIVFDRFRQKHPKRFFNLGIAEANMVGVAAGLAACGKVPFVYTIGTFLVMRAFEQIRNDVCLQQMNVKLVGIGAGFVYSDLGPTHHVTEDIALMNALPGMTILAPADPVEAAAATLLAAEIKGPVYLRLSTGGAPQIHGRLQIQIELGKAMVVHQGWDISIISHGLMVHEVLAAARGLEEAGITVRVINMICIKPLDKEIICQAAEETGAMMVVEEHAIEGGLGAIVAAHLLEAGSLPRRFKCLGLKDSFATGYGSHEVMKEMNRLSCRHIMSAAKKLLQNVEEHHGQATELHNPPSHSDQPGLPGTNTGR